jgi:hypothetical protein
VELERRIADAVAGRDAARLADDFRRRELLFFDPLFGADVIAALRPDVERLRGRAHRSWVPGYKRSASLSAFQLRREAPAVTALYDSPAFLAFLRGVTGQPLVPAPARDPHAFAVYYYTRPGDGVGFHYDQCHYKQGSAYTLLLGLVNDSGSRLICRPGRCRQRLHTEEYAFATHPGAMVLFNGCSVFHGLTPLGPGEERIVYTAVYLTDPTISAVGRLMANVNYSINYFGPSIFIGR